MEEKIIMQSKACNLKKVTIIIASVAVLLSILIFAVALIGQYNSCRMVYEGEITYKNTILFRCTHDVNSLRRLRLAHPDVASYMFCRLHTSYVLGDTALALTVLQLSVFAFLLFINLMVRKTTLTVTDKRVYGKTLFNIRVDLPLDKISSVGTSIFKGINVGSSSGRIKFKLIKNYEEIHTALIDLLMQNRNHPPA